MNMKTYAEKWYAKFGTYGEASKYASNCGAGAEGSSGFQPGNTCGGEGDGDGEEEPKTAKPKKAEAPAPERPGKQAALPGMEDIAEDGDVRRMSYTELMDAFESGEITEEQWKDEDARRADARARVAQENRDADRAMEAEERRMGWDDPDDPRSDAPAAAPEGEGAAPAPDAYDSTPGNLASGMSVAKSPWGGTWFIEKDELMDTDAGFFKSEEQARLAAFASSVSDVVGRELQAFVGYAEDRELPKGYEPDLHPDDLEEMADRFRDNYIGDYEVKEVSGRNIPVGWAEEFIDDMGGLGEIPPDQVAYHIDVDKWQADLDSYDEGYGARESETEEGVWEVYDRQDPDVESSGPYNTEYEAERAAREVNEDLLNELMSTESTMPATGERHSERYFDYDSWTRDLIIGGELTWTDNPDGSTTWFWNR